jgi:hypothetical protein
LVLQPGYEQVSQAEHACGTRGLGALCTWAPLVEVHECVLECSPLGERLGDGAVATKIICQHFVGKLISVYCYARGAAV